VLPRLSQGQAPLDNLCGVVGTLEHAHDAIAAHSR
jgi:hypothetical protein